MIVGHLVNSISTELSFSKFYDGYDIVVRNIIPYKGRSWFTCYVNKKKDFTEDELDNIPKIIITYNEVYSNQWAKSSLSDEEVIGWDYRHGLDEELYITLEDVFKDAYRVVDYLNDICGGI